MKLQLCIIVIGLNVAFGSGAFGGEALFGIPASPVLWDCTIRCYAEASGTGKSEWLDKANDFVTVCGTSPTDLQLGIDGVCARLFSEKAVPGVTVKGYFNYPITPGNPIACKNTGTKCAKVGPVPTIWECPASCRSSGTARREPRNFSLCAFSKVTAFHGGIRLFGASSPHRLCPSGWVLDEAEGNDLFGDPPHALCRNSQKECDIRL